LDIEIPSSFFSPKASTLLCWDGVPQHPVSTCTISTATPHSWYQWQHKGSGHLQMSYPPHHPPHQSHNG
jgi:hypothetical protein